jgi:hypothetical protein
METVAQCISEEAYDERILTRLGIQIAQSLPVLPSPTPSVVSVQLAESTPLVTKVIVPNVTTGPSEAKLNGASCFRDLSSALLLPLALLLF